MNVGGKGIIQLKCGEQLFVHTPGGGGWGVPRAVNGDSNNDAGIAEKQPQYWRATGSLHQYAATQNEG